MRESFNRKEIYNLLWSQPTQVIAKRYGVSDVALKKRIPGDIPWPPRGYWQKSEAWRASLRPALPPRGPGASDTIHLGSRDFDRQAEYDRKLDELQDDLPHFPEPLSKVRARLEASVKGAKAARDLRDPDVSLKRLLEKDARKALKLSQNKWAWEKPLFDGQFEQRRLRIISGLGRALAAFGTFKLDPDTGRSIRFETSGARLDVDLDHPKAKKARDGSPHVHGGPSGPLRLRIGVLGRTPDYRPEWEDDEEGKLEAKLSSIALDILVAAEAELRAASFREHARLHVARDHRDQVREQRRLTEERIAREQREEAERQQRQALRDQASNWRAANDIRALVAAARAKGDNTDLEAWTSWALAEADRMDPLISGALERASRELIS